MSSDALITRQGFRLIEAYNSIQQGRNEKSGFQLYNMLDDNKERIELAAKHPEQFEHLRQVFKRELNSPRPEHK